MKKIVISLLILFIIISVFLELSAVFSAEEDLKAIIEEMLMLESNEDYSALSLRITKTELLLHEHNKKLFLLYRHEDLDEIMESLSELRIYSNAKDRTETKIRLNKLLHQAEELSRNIVLSFENIL